MTNKRSNTYVFSATKNADTEDLFASLSAVVKSFRKLFPQYRFAVKRFGRNPNRKQFGDYRQNLPLKYATSWDYYLFVSGKGYTYETQKVVNTLFAARAGNLLRYHLYRNHITAINPIYQSVVVD